MVKINKNLALMMLVASIAVTGIGYAAFSDKGKVLGSSFSVGSADIKFLKDLAAGSTPSNLADELPGPHFNNLGPNWTKDYVMKVYNNATQNLILTSNAFYETANDTEDLRSIIYVEPFVWNDDNDGTFEQGELGTTYGKKTIIKWKTEGYNLGQITTGEIKSIVLRFSTETVSDTKQGASAVFDFEFSGVGVN